MDPPVTTVDLGVTWNWEYDVEFIGMIEYRCRLEGLSVSRIQRQSIEENLALLREKKLYFRFFLDRASDDDDSFHPLAHTIARGHEEGRTRVINPLHLQLRAADKATMHLEFLSHGIEVPYTIIISPYNHKRELELSLTELSRLGRPFIIKPANTTGGGMGVVMGAETLKDVLEARQHHKNDKYLLQETVRPAFLSENRAWFRIFYAFGEIIACWWDDQTHIYEEVSTDDVATFGLEPLEAITKKVSEVCQLDFFSTELAYTPSRRFIAVDYVNEVCDMRLQSRHRDGVPDAVVERIIDSMLRFIRSS